MDSFRILPSPEWMGPELRDYKRIDLELPVSVWELAGGNSVRPEEYTGILLDLSAGGAMINLETVLKVKSGVRLRFDLTSLLDLPEGETRVLEINGIIRQALSGPHDELLYGVEFREFVSGSEESIEALVTNNA